MPTLTSLGAADLRQALLRFRDAVRSHQEELNRLNVYPVPDGDTGTNMALTLESVSAALAQAESMADVCHAISRGSLMGARGNSGVILSQILRGLADECREHDEMHTRELVRGFRHAADAAYEAVMRPVEGTILTVARAIAESVEALDAPSLVTMLEQGAAAGRVTRSRAPRTCCRYCGRQVSSTRAGRGSRCCSTRCSRSSTAVRSPSRSSSRRRRRSPRISRAKTTCRVCATRSCTSSTRRHHDLGVPRGVGGDRRLDRGRGR